jgi:hypothetical protein
MRKNEFKNYNGLCGTGFKKKEHIDITVCEREGRRLALLDFA